MQKFSITCIFLMDVRKNYHRLQAFLSHIALGSVLVAGSVVVSSAQAEHPDVARIIAQMNAVFEPARPSIRKVSISVNGDKEANSPQWVIGEARKKFTDGKRTLFVILEPHSLRGSAFLFLEQGEQEDRLWTYFPELGGMRGIIGVDAYEHFLQTDFTYADLGLVSRPGRYRLLGEEEHDGARAYKIDEAPKERWYYSRVVTWVDTESLLPLERNLYDRAGRLWKRIVFDHVTPINGIPTPLRIRMVDVQQEGSTELLMSGVRYDVELPDELFDPAGLPQVIASPLWDPFSTPSPEDN